MKFYASAIQFLQQACGDHINTLWTIPLTYNWLTCIASKQASNPSFASILQKNQESVHNVIKKKNNVINGHQTARPRQQTKSKPVFQKQIFLISDILTSAF